MGIKQLPPCAGEHLFQIVMRRYETRSTLMTSNRSIEEWGKLFGDVPAATAILGRFLHHAEIINIKDRPYRLQNRLDASTDAENGSAHCRAARGTKDQGRKPDDVTIDETRETT